MKKFTILCDADDTIVNLTDYWISELNQTYRQTVQKNDIKSWDLTKAYPTLSPEEVLKPLYRKNFWDNITPVEGSRYYLERLIKAGHSLYIVTASNLETSEAKTKKLLKLFPFLRREQIIFTQNKQCINGDILIDDGVHNLIGGKYRKFLFHQPNNSVFHEKKHGITRVYSWKEIYEQIQNLAA